MGILSQFFWCQVALIPPQNKNQSQKNILYNAPFKTFKHNTILYPEKDEHINRHFLSGLYKADHRATRNARPQRARRTGGDILLARWYNGTGGRVEGGKKWHVRKRSSGQKCLKAWIRVTELYLQRTTERRPIRKPLIALPSFSPCFFAQVLYQRFWSSLCPSFLARYLYCFTSFIHKILNL